MTITCIYPEDMSILENKLIDTLTDIAIQKFTSEEIDLIVDYLEENDCKYFDLLMRKWLISLNRVRINIIKNLLKGELI